jgi:hypothetical protein
MIAALLSVTQYMRVTSGPHAGFFGLVEGVGLRGYIRVTGYPGEGARHRSTVMVRRCECEVVRMAGRAA